MSTGLRTGNRVSFLPTRHTQCLPMSRRSEVILDACPYKAPQQEYDKVDRATNEEKKSIILWDWGGHGTPTGRNDHTPVGDHMSIDREDRDQSDKHVSMSYHRT